MSPYGDVLVEWAGLANSEHNRLRAFILNSEKATAFGEKEEQAKKRNFAKIEANSFASTPSQLVRSTKLFARQTVVRAVCFYNKKQLLYSCFVVETTGLANSEHIYMRACSVTEVTTCAKHKTVCKANSGSSRMFL